MISWDEMGRTLAVMQNNSEKKRVCIGFDGYIDTLYRVVKTRKNIQDCECFLTISSFADRVIKAAGRSADMELQLVSKRMGGNAPLMAEAMACLNASTRCIGTMGYPEPDDLFSENQVQFIPESIAPCAESIAFEFMDGKLMFGNTLPLQVLDWDRITRVCNLDILRQWYCISNLWAVVNWSFVLNCNGILEGFLRDVVEPCDPDGEKIIFFDLADPSGRSKADMQHLFALMKKFSAKNRVVLSMNENESVLIADALDLQGEELTAEERAEAIRERLDIWMTSIHGLDYAVAATEDQIVQEKGIFVPNPTISTGGGDHFNGGFATALIHDLSAKEAIGFGNLVSSCYVSNGSSPALEDLQVYLDKCRA